MEWQKKDPTGSSGLFFGVVLEMTGSDLDPLLFGWVHRRGLVAVAGKRDRAAGVGGFVDCLHDVDGVEGDRIVGAMRAAGAGGIDEIGHADSA